MNVKIDSIKVLRYLLTKTSRIRAGNFDEDSAMMNFITDRVAHFFDWK